MHYIKQKDFDDFKCIADKCEESCCIGWQIMIDEDSLERYKHITGEFGDRIKASVDWKEECFKQNGSRCAFLNDENLCDLHKTLGEQALCRTCDKYPRHEEEFENVREYSLSLSCPHAAKSIISSDEDISFIEWDDDLEEEYEEFDYLLYDRLVDARDIIYKIIQDEDVSFEIRMERIIAFADALQDCIDDGEVFDMDVCLEAWRAGDYPETPGEDFESSKNMFSILFELEMLHDDWLDSLDNAWKMVFGADKKAWKHYHELLNEWKDAAKKLLTLLVYTYFCGAVYDDWIYSKAALCVYFVKWIFIMCAANEENCGVDELAKIVYRLARELEHSDENLDYLEEWFDKNRKC